ncbi:MAG: YitT family protein [Actinobacteria bacterium]|nr:YitT family protein [Actinomycetota bacterium]
MALRIPRPSRAVPQVRWSATSYWRLSPLSWVVLLLGLVIFGIGEGLLVQSHFGATPWTVFALGLAHQTGWAIGWATACTSALVMLGWIPLRERIGVGSILNAAIFPFVLDATVTIVPTPHSLMARIALMVAGLLVFALGASLYLSTRTGPGPRDGLMTGLQKRFDWPIAWIRTTLEALAMTAGWLMGGTVGLGTALFVLGIGYFIAMYFSLWRHVAPSVA